MAVTGHISFHCKRRGGFEAIHSHALSVVMKRALLHTIALVKIEMEFEIATMNSKARHVL